MLFSSYTFILLFLPLTLSGFFAAGRFGRKPALLWLLAASLFFYGYWSPPFLALLALSMAFNYGMGRSLEVGSLTARTRKLLLYIAVGGNLGLLGYYKYADFAYGTFCRWSGHEYSSLGILLPLGISFFTFQQVGYIVDRYRNVHLDYDLIDYMLFVVYFPQLIAGPIVSHRDIIPQFHDPEILRPRADRFAIGLSIFFVGLFKKCVVADELARFVGPAFAMTAEGTTLPMYEAWIALLAYTFQLYFDFSGYSDMAVGLGRTCGLQMPLNFDSPYKAVSVIDFWRRWHITLSLFLRDHLYIPLGGGRCGTARRYTNLFLTMLLGGLWHGAGWGFILWGAMHGALLVVNHAWRAVRKAWLPSTVWDALPFRLLAGAVTFLSVSLAWVLFRAGDLDAALRYFTALFQFHDLSFTARFDAAKAWGWLSLAAFIVWCVPNTHQLFRSLEEASTRRATQSADEALPAGGILAWRFSPLHAGAIALLAIASLVNMGRVQEFLYFQF
ncbi:MAG: MBOAT family protein [Planctomycetia bacterium]|nr:MBOAT family protein [Planctomycetia bacterium]